MADISNSSGNNTENMENTQNSSHQGENSNRAEGRWSVDGRWSCTSARSGHSSDDFSVRGTFKKLSHESGDFISNLNEMIENCLDNDSNIIKIILKETNGKYYIGTSSNGKGIDKKVMKSMFRCSDYKSTRSDKHGMFGVGSTRARIFFMGFKGNVLYLSCHKELTEQEKGDNRFYAPDKFAEVDMDMEQTYIQDRIVKSEPKNEIGRPHERLWNDFSIDPDSTGVVELMEISKEMFDLTNKQINHPDIGKNLMANIAWTFESDLKGDKTIMINDDIVENIPDWRDCDQAKKLTNDITLVDEVETDFPENCDRVVEELFIVSDEGNKVEMAYKKDKYQKKRIGKKKRKIGETVLQHKATFWSGGDKRLRELIDVLSPWFDKIGVKYSGIESKIYNFIFRDCIVRNNKKIPLEKEIIKKSGDTNQYQCMDNVENLWYIVKKVNKTDYFVGIRSDKSHIVLVDVDPDLRLIMRVCKININKTTFFKKFIKPNLPDKKKNKKKEAVESESDGMSSNDDDNIEQEIYGNYLLAEGLQVSQQTFNQNKQVNEDEKLAEGLQVSQQTFENEEQKADAIQMTIQNVSQEESEIHNNGQLNFESPVAPSTTTNNISQKNLKRFPHVEEKTGEGKDEESTRSPVSSRSGTLIPEHNRDASCGINETTRRLNWLKENSEKFDDDDRKRIIIETYDVGNTMISKVFGDKDNLVKAIRNRHSNGTVSIVDCIDDLIDLYNRYYATHNGDNTCHGGSKIMKLHETMELHLNNL